MLCNVIYNVDFFNLVTVIGKLVKDWKTELVPLFQLFSFIIQCFLSWEGKKIVPSVVTLVANNFCSHLQSILELCVVVQ